MRAIHSASALLLAAVCLAAGASAAPTTRLILSASTPSPQVRCGEPLAIRVSLRNEARWEVRLYLKGLRLKSEDGANLPLALVAGSAPVIEEPGRDPKKPSRRYARILSGSSALFETMDPGAAVGDLGRHTRSYTLSGDAPEFSSLLPQPAVASVGLEVLPSRLMTAAWKARTPQQVRRTLPDFLALLRRNKGTHMDPCAQTTLRYMAGAALPLLDMVLREGNAQDRVNALAAYRYAVWAVGAMSDVRRAYGRRGYRPDWLALVPRGDEESARNSFIRQARRALTDESPAVRIAALDALASPHSSGFLSVTKEVAADPSPLVRKALVACLASYMDDPAAARRVADAVSDPDPGVQAAALHDLETSAFLPPRQVLADLLKHVRGEGAVRVVAMLRQQEDASLPALLEPGFGARTPTEQEAILTVLAGHSDAATLRIVRLGLASPDAAVQRLALMRLLQFPADTARSALDAVRNALASQNTSLADSLRLELLQRAVFPFLARPGAPLAVASTQAFPSHGGTLPQVSPDGQWVAYQDVGGSRPGGSGGAGRSNLVSLVHLVRADGTGDRIVSDMFPRGWMADSKGIGSARDGFAAITDLDGNIKVEFGEHIFPAPVLPAGEPADWRQREMRQQNGTGRMPHKQTLRSMGLAPGEVGEEAAFSPNGKWFGPLRTPTGGLFVGADGSFRPVMAGEGPLSGPVAWSPQADRIAFVNEQGHLTIFNTNDQTRTDLGPAQPPPHGRWAGDPVWRPWDRDGRRLAFVRDGEVWVCDADGQRARQLTFDSTPKRLPVFSPDGSRVAYIACQPDGRQYYEPPTDVWVVDIRTELAARVTGPDGARTAGLSWLDRDRLIFDRQGGHSPAGQGPGLLVADLSRAAAG